MNIAEYAVYFCVAKSYAHYMYRKGTSIPQAPVWTVHLSSITEKPIEVYQIWMNELVITLHVAGFLRYTSNNAV